MVMKNYYTQSEYKELIKHMQILCQTKEQKNITYLSFCKYETNHLTSKK